MEKVILREVAPRGGWQNLRLIDVSYKKQLIAKMLNSGVKELEACSFVNPKRVPQMEVANEIAEYALKIRNSDFPDAVLSALVPNKKGAEKAVEAGVDAVDICYGPERRA